jgi:hypothetical protein
LEIFAWQTPFGMRNAAEETVKRIELLPFARGSQFAVEEFGGGADLGK